MDKAVRGVLVGKLFELEMSDRYEAFKAEFDHEDYDYKDCAAHSSAFLWELAYSFFGDDLPPGVHIKDGSSCPRAFLDADQTPFWRAVEIRYRLKWVGRSDQELRQAYIRLRMKD